jgi:hypothetical protein
LQQQVAEAQAAAAAAAWQWQAEVADLRQRLAAPPRQGDAAPGAGTVGATHGPAGSEACPTGQGSWQSEVSGGCSSSSAAASGRSAADLTSERVTWGRTLTGRAPAARPQSVPPVDLSRLRWPADPRGPGHTHEPRV